MIFETPGLTPLDAPSAAYGRGRLKIDPDVPFPDPPPPRPDLPPFPDPYPDPGLPEPADPVLPDPRPDPPPVYSSPRPSISRPSIPELRRQGPTTREKATTRETANV